MKNTLPLRKTINNDDLMFVDNGPTIAVRNSGHHMYDIRPTDLQTFIALYHTSVTLAERLCTLYEMPENRKRGVMQETRVLNRHIKVNFITMDVEGDPEELRGLTHVFTVCPVDEFGMVSHVCNIREQDIDGFFEDLGNSFKYAIDRWSVGLHERYPLQRVRRSEVQPYVPQVKEDGPSSAVPQDIENND